MYSPVTKPLVCDCRYWLGAYFCEPSKISAVPSQENQISFEIWGCNVILWGLSEYVWGPRRVTFRGHDEHAWGQRLGYDVRDQDAIEGHTCPLIDLWPHTYSSWPHSITSHLQLISKLLWFSLTWRNCIFAWITKIATESLLIVTHQGFLYA